MATIVFDEEIDPLVDSLLGITFGKSQAGDSIRRKSGPCVPNSDRRSFNWTILARIMINWKSMNATQQRTWGVWAGNNGISAPFGRGIFQQGYAAMLFVQVQAAMAGHVLYTNPPPNLPYMGVNFTNLVRIDKDTIRATFNPSPSGGFRHPYLRQTLPTPGRTDPTVADSYVADIADHNVTSPHDFSTRFQHLAGWHARYFTGSQDHLERRSTEDQWDL